ncbi:MAG: hypothetical protein AAGA83_10065 [Cyanobacteria bacterium P01_F01_bin.116]
MFKNNIFENVSIDKNIGGTSIIGNTGAVLICTDNNPAPTGSGNTITELADKQCAKFKNSSGSPSLQDVPGNIIELP